MGHIIWLTSYKSNVFFEITCSVLLKFNYVSLIKIGWLKNIRGAEMVQPRWFEPLTPELLPEESFMRASGEKDRGYRVGAKFLQYI